jgi:hypothetical protein
MDYHRMAELHHTARASAYASVNHAKATGHRARAAMHARASRLRFGGPAAGEAANAEALGLSLSCPISLALFVDPVVISTGQTVERTHIERVLRGPESTHRCPVSNVSITRALVTNWLVRSIVDDFIKTYGAREGDEWEGARALCHPKPEPSAAAAAAAAPLAVADTEEAAKVKMYVQMPYEELVRLSDETDDADDDDAFREIVRRCDLYRWIMIDLDDYYDNGENTGHLPGDVVAETAGEVANDVLSTEALLGLIRARENNQLRRFGAQHLTAFARHEAAATASDVPFKLLFGLPITMDREEYEDKCVFGQNATIHISGFWEDEGVD